MCSEMLRISDIWLVASFAWNQLWFETSEIATRNLPTSVRSKRAISDCAQKHAPHFSGAVLDKLKNVKGIVFKDRNKVINTGLRPLIMDLDKIPFPARTLTPYKKYSSLFAKRTPITTMETSRGCPYKCIFCDRPHLGKMFRARSPKNVADEIEECVNLGIKEILIYDDTFTINRKRVVDICNEIITRKLDISWDIRARVNTVDSELLNLMKKAGCEKIHYCV